MINYENELKDLIGEEVFSMLKAGKAFLRKWTRTSPSNYYITPIENEHNYIWHSSNDNWVNISILIPKCFIKIKTIDSETVYRLKDEI